MSPPWKSAPGCCRACAEVLRGNRYELRNATMLDLIRTVYNVNADKVTGGPSWLEWNRYDVRALAPDGSQPAVLREMLKALLADRLGLKLREDQVTATGMALKVIGAGTPNSFAPPALALLAGVEQAES